MSKRVTRSTFAELKKTWPSVRSDEPISPPTPPPVPTQTAPVIEDEAESRVVPAPATVALPKP